MSKHEAIVVPVKLEKHPNSENLSIVKINDYCCVARTEDWQGIDKAVYIEPDTLVDTTLPQFHFLAADGKYQHDSTNGGTFARIKCKKLRGVQSYGLLVPAPPEANLGDDYWEKWNLARYEPPINNNTAKGNGIITGGEVAAAPSKHGDLPKYDVENALKYARKVFTENEDVVVSLKYHGMNGSFVYSDGQYYARSRTEFKKEFATPPKVDKDELIKRLGEEKGLEVFNSLTAKFANWCPERNLWWRVLRENPELEKFVRDNPDTVVFGEVIGVQGKNFLYGLNPGQVSYRAFDIYKNKTWMNYKEARDLGKDLKWVRILKECPFNLDELIHFVENMGIYDNVNGQVEEGIVVKPVIERWHTMLGRVQVKLINPKY